MSIVKAIVECAAGERLAGNAWATMVKAVVQDEVRKERLKQYFLDAEKEYKEQTKETHLPASWRSNKSTLMGAVEVGCEIVNIDGVPRPKSVLSVEIRQKKMVKPVTFSTKLGSLDRLIRKMYDEAINEDKVSMSNWLDTLAKELS